MRRFFPCPPAKHDNNNLNKNNSTRRFNKNIRTAFERGPQDKGKVYTPVLLPMFKREAESKPIVLYKALFDKNMSKERKIRQLVLLKALFIAHYNFCHIFAQKNAVKCTTESW